MKTPEEVAALRREMGLTQAGLAHDMGVSVRTVQGWEGKGMPEQAWRHARLLLGIRNLKEKYS